MAKEYETVSNVTKYFYSLDVEGETFLSRDLCYRIVHAIWETNDFFLLL